MALNGNNPQTGLMATYDASRETLIIDGKQVYGYMDGQNMCSVAWDTDQVTVTQDPMGTTVKNINHKNAATATVTLNQTSPFNQVLTDLCNQHKDFSIDSSNGIEHWYAAHCYISKMADATAGDTSSARAWTIHLLNAHCESLLRDNQ